MLVTIIIPVYNTARYLPGCLDSILAQTYTDFECILIDDGSTDNSGEICDTYAAKDPRLKVFHTKNAGVSSARNLALSHTFVTTARQYLDAAETYILNLTQKQHCADCPLTAWCKDFSERSVLL